MHLNRGDEMTYIKKFLYVGTLILAALALLVGTQAFIDKNNNISSLTTIAKADVNAEIEYGNSNRQNAIDKTMKDESISLPLSDGNQFKLSNYFKPNYYGYSFTNATQGTDTINDMSQTLTWDSSKPLKVFYTTPMAYDANVEQYDMTTGKQIDSFTTKLFTNSYPDMEDKKVIQNDYYVSTPLGWASGNDKFQYKIDPGKDSTLPEKPVVKLYYRPFKPVTFNYYNDAGEKLYSMDEPASASVFIFGSGTSEEPDTLRDQDGFYSKIPEGDKEKYLQGYGKPESKSDIKADYAKGTVDVLLNKQEINLTTNYYASVDGNLIPIKDSETDSIPINSTESLKVPSDISDRTFSNEKTTVQVVEQSGYSFTLGNNTDNYVSDSDSVSGYMSDLFDLINDAYVDNPVGLDITANLVFDAKDNEVTNPISFETSDKKVVDGKQVIYGVVGDKFPLDELKKLVPKGYELVNNSELTIKDSSDSSLPQVVLVKKIGSNSEQNNNNSSTNNVNLKAATYPEDGIVSLYDDNGKASDNRALAQNTDWLVDKKRMNTVNGKKTVYYRVSTHEWVKVPDIYIYQDLSNNVLTTKQTNLYNTHGSLVNNRALMADTSWKVDRSSSDIIDGVLMYRVSTNEWVKADDVVTENG